MTSRFVALCAALLLFAAVPAQAQDAPPDMARIWQDLARLDAEAALHLIEENHPGARPEVGDGQFQASLALARQHLAERLPRVRDYPGYSAVLAGLANDFGDGHIWSSAQYSPNRLAWAGLVAERRDRRWLVAADLNEGGDLAGAELLSCDGRPAEEIGRERIGLFRANPEVEAALARQGYALLIDDGNPFVRPLASCRFGLASGEEVERPLVWRTALRTAVTQQIGQVLRRPQAGLSVERFEGGWWIALGTLSADAARVVEQAEAVQAELRTAPLVVLDLRGNGGGNSEYAAQLVRLLAGDEALRALESGGEDGGACVGEFWRATPDNARSLRAFAASAAAGQQPALLEQADAIDRAASAGQAFAPALPACAADAPGTPRPPAALPTLAMTGRLVLVTDRACFSSCLIAADMVRRLGALHVGEATDRSTRYMEVREELLPSGLRTFSTLMKLALGEGDYGPYDPAVAYPGELADTDALKAWVATHAASR